MALEGNIGPAEDAIVLSTEQTVIADANIIPLVDGTTLKKTLWSTIKSTLKTYFDGLYATIPSVTVVTDTYQILVTDYTIVCNKATAFTVTLPTAVVGQIFTIKNINTGLVTLEGSGSDTIDGELNQTINQWDAVKVQCYAANSWIII